MSVTGGIMAGVGLAGSIGSAAIGSSAASSAASTQANAADYAANLQAQESQKALDFQKSEYNTSQAQLAPYLQAGNNGLNALQYGIGIGGTANGSGVGQGSLTAAYPGGQFTAPTAQSMEQNDPGYQAREQLGTQALQQSAAASGNLLTGGTAEALDAFAQNYASNEYNNYYNQAYNTYSSNYNQYQNQQTGQYNKLAALSGLGSQTASTLGTLGQSAATGVTNNLLTSAAQQGQDLTNAGTANASGIVGSANAWSGAVGNSSSNLSNLYLLNSLFGNNAGGTAAGSAGTPGDPYSTGLAAGELSGLG